MHFESPGDNHEFEKWRTRPLPPIAYMTLDATYHKVRIDGVVRDCATLSAYGIRCDDGKRIILGVSCALSEAEVHWRVFLNGLKERGIGIPRLVTSDAHSGLKAARPHDASWTVQPDARAENPYTLPDASLTAAIVVSEGGYSRCTLLRRTVDAAEVCGERP